MAKHRFEGTPSSPTVEDMGGIPDINDQEIEERIQELQKQDLADLSQEALDDLLLWLSDEYYELRDGQTRSELEEYWQTWRRMSQARPNSKSKNDPWDGASNVTTPFMFSNINGVATHVKTALTEKNPRVSVECHSSSYKNHAKSVERLMNALIESPIHANWKAYDDPIAYDTARMGTQVVETPWEERRIQLKRRTGDGQYEVVDTTVYAGPGTTLYRLEDVMVRPEYDSPQDAPAIQFRSFMNRQDLETLAASGYFMDVEDIFGQSIDEIEESREAEMQTMGLDGSAIVGADSPATLYEIVKAYARFDGDDDGVPEDYVVWYEPETQTALRIEFNELGTRPISVSRHIFWPGEFYGGGVGWMLQPIQDEIDTLHNMRVDNLHISSLQMFAVPTGGAIGPREALYPLKQWQLDSPRDFQVIQFPDNSMSTLQAEQVAQQYGRTVTGISETQLGMPDTTAKSGTTPTLQQFLAQQGNKVLRSIIQNAELAQSERATHAFLQLVANSEEVLSRGDLLELVDESDRENIHEILMMSIEDVSLKFKFSVHATKVDETEDAKRQMLMVKQQMFTMYTQQAMQLQQVLANPQLPAEMKEFITQLYVGQTKLMEEALTLYDVDNVSDYLPSIRMQELMLQMVELQRQPMIAQLEDQMRRATGEDGSGYGMDTGSGPGMGGPNGGAGVGPAQRLPGPGGGGIPGQAGAGGAPRGNPPVGGPMARPPQV